MGANWVTSQFEKIGLTLLKKSDRFSPQWSRRLTFLGTELVETRATWHEYNKGVQEFRKQWAEGLLGRDIGGIIVVTFFIFGGWNVGQILGRKQLEPQIIPASKYDDHHHDESHH